MSSTDNNPTRGEAPSAASEFAPSEPAASAPAINALSKTAGDSSDAIAAAANAAQNTATETTGNPNRTGNSAQSEHTPATPASACPGASPGASLGASLEASPADSVVVIDGAGGSVWAELVKLWQYRELMFFLIWRDLRVRYRQTILGVAWAILRPVLTMIVFTVIFGQWVGMDTGDIPYPVFVYAGLLPWTLFNGSVSQGSMSLLNNSHLFTKVYFPRSILPLSTIGVVVVDFALAAVVYAAIMLYYGFAPPVAIIFLPAMIALTLSLAVGLSLMLSGWAVMYRDLRAIIPFALQSWMYLSPVIYPVTIIPDKYRWLLRLNPLVGIIDGFRACMLGTAISAADLTSAVVISLAALVAGAFAFSRSQQKLADIA